MSTEEQIDIGIIVGRESIRKALRIIKAKRVERLRRSGISANAEPFCNVLEPDALGRLLERGSSPERISQLAEFLSAIEPSAASLAVSKAGELELAVTRIALARMRSVTVLYPGRAREPD